MLGGEPAGCGDRMDRGASGASGGAIVPGDHGRVELEWRERLRPRPAGVPVEQVVLELGRADPRLDLEVARPRDAQPVLPVLSAGALSPQEELAAAKGGG